MAQVWTHSVLEAAVCQAKLDDAMKVRYGKAGPSRQGQAGHRLAERYLAHLHETKRDSDMEEGDRIWKEIRGQLSAEDEAGIAAAATAFIHDSTYPWVPAASDFACERVMFLTVPDRTVVPAERVHLIEGPVFRVTVDAAWQGVGPLPGPVGRSVLDWKFHWNVEHVEEPTTNRQLRRYAAALYGWDEPVACYIGFPRRSYYEAAVIDEAALRDAWEAQVVAPIMEAQKALGRTDKTVGAHCRICDLRRGCDAALRYPYEMPWVDGATPQERLVSLMLAKLLVGDLTERVREDVVAAGGNVTAGEDRATMSESESLTFTEEQLRAVLPAEFAAEDLRAMFQATKTTLEKWLTKRKVKPVERAAIVERLRAIADRTLTSVLRTGKTPKERVGGSTED